MKVLVDFFQSVSLTESAVFLIYLLIGSGTFFLLKVWFPQYLHNKQIEADREDRKAEVMETTLRNMTTLLQSNTSAIESFNRSISVLDTTLEKVSDKLYAHDAESKILTENVKSINQELSRFKADIPNMIDINRLHQRLDEMKNTVGDKNDIKLIMAKLDQILEDVLEIKGQLSK